jgi:hypothetical protein
MGFYKQFETFDPLEERVVVSGLDFYLPDITRRARTLLSGRTKAEVISIAEMADWFIDQFFEEEPELINAVDRHGTDFFALVNSIDRYALDEDDDFFPTRKPDDYFAVLALWKVADAISAGTADCVASTRADLENRDSRASLASLDAIVRGSSEKERMSVQYATAAAASVEAMQAICWAEHLEKTGTHEAEITRLRIQLITAHEAAADAERAAMDLADQRAKQKISLNSQKAAIARHAEDLAVKAEVFAWCADHLGDKNAEAAAEEIAGKIAPIKPSTARRYIYEYRKSIRSAR